MSSRLTSSATVDSDRIVHEGGRNVCYDLSGQNTEFQKQFQLTYYTRGDQTIELPYPAWFRVPKSSQSLGIIVEMLPDTITDTSAATEPVKLNYDEQWFVDEEDETAMGKAYTLWNDNDHAFDGVLVKKIRVNIGGSNNLTLRVTYQAFYQDFIDTKQFRTETGSVYSPDFGSVRGPVYSRELGQYLLDSIDKLDAKTQVLLRNMFADTMSSDDILDEDLTGQAMRNLVRFECHNVDTTQGQNMLAPARGPFYPGEKSTIHEFKMFHCYKTETMIDSTVIGAIRRGEPSSYDGWLFIYTTNNIRLYKETEDTTFLAKVTYYRAEANGSYVELKEGTDYEVGDKVADYKHGGVKTKVYELKSVPYDTRSNFEGGVNDSKAVITKECQVILTAENVNDYANYYGTVVDVQCRDIQNRSREMALGTDYEFADVDLAKTERCLIDQPVYNHARLLCDMVTDQHYCVAISYQAFGGHVTAADMRAVRKDVANAMEILGKSQMLTVNNLEKQTVIKDLIARLRRIENYHDHFMQVDHQVFKGAGGFHWINIAEIYDLNWLNTVDVVRELGTFRVHSRDLGWTYEFAVTADVSQPDHLALAVKTIGALGPKTEGFENFYNLGVKENIGLRLCWKEDDGEPGKRCGVVLQLGWDYDKYNYSSDTTEWDTDTVTVTNKSGNTSMWSLYYTPLEVTPYTDASINILGHVRYEPYSGVAEQDIPYYQELTEYLYYKTGCVTVRDGVEFFQKDESTQTFYKITPPAGTPIASLGDVYERSVYKRIYQRRTVQVGQKVPDGTYVIDEITSYNDDSFSMPNREAWVKGLPECHYSTKLLESDNSGILAWAGNYPLKWYSFGPNKAVRPVDLHLSLSETVQNMLDVTAITKVAFDIYDRRTGRYFTNEMVMTATGEGVTLASRGECVFFFEDLCGIQIAICPDKFKTLAKDTKVAADTKYYVWDTNSGTRVEVDLSAWVGSTISSLITQGKIADRTYYKVDDTLGQSRCVAHIEVGVGTSSYINDRFDFRQIRLHF